MKKESKASKTESAKTIAKDSVKDKKKTLSDSNENKSDKNKSGSTDTKASDAKDSDTKAVSADSDEDLFNAINKYEKDPVEKDKTAEKKEKSSAEDKQLKKPDSTFDIITAHSGKCSLFCYASFFFHLFPRVK